MVRLLSHELDSLLQQSAGLRQQCLPFVGAAALQHLLQQGLEQIAPVFCRDTGPAPIQVVAVDMQILEGEALSFRHYLVGQAGEAVDFRPPGSAGPGFGPQISAFLTSSSQRNSSSPSRLSQRRITFSRGSICMS